MKIERDKQNQKSIHDLWSGNQLIYRMQLI